MSYKYYKHEIRVVSYQEIKQFKSKVTKEGVVMDKDTSYIGLEVEGDIVGFMGTIQVKNGGVRVKGGWIDPKWRKQGIYGILLDKILDMHKKTKEITAFCNEATLKPCMDRGFEIQGNQSKVTFVKKINKDA